MNIQNTLLFTRQRGVIFMKSRDCLEEFRMDCDLRRLSKRTIIGYYNNIAKFLIFIENKHGVYELDAITAIHIKSYLQYLIKKDLSASYANGILKSLRAYFKYAIGEDYIAENPTLRVNWQKVGKTLIETFNEDEVKALINAFGKNTYLQCRNRLILAIAFDTGARNTEICNIKIEDIKDNIILIHGKGNKERNVPLTPYLRKLMIKYERLRALYFEDKVLIYSNYLLSRTGRPLTKEALEHIFNQANEKANVRSEIRCSPHTARHYYAQTNLKNGLDIYSLSRLLGHENINITKTYLQSLQDKDIVKMAVATSPLRYMKY